MRALFKERRSPQRFTSVFGDFRRVCGRKAAVFNIDCGGKSHYCAITNDQNEAKIGSARKLRRCGRCQTANQPAQRKDKIFSRQRAIQRIVPIGAASTCAAFSSDPEDAGQIRCQFEERPSFRAHRSVCLSLESRDGFQNPHGSAGYGGAME